jgi:CDP-paratose 2-epimerase
MQLATTTAEGRPRLVNVGGGEANTFSLAELTAWCAERFGFSHPVAPDPEPRPHDLPWVVMDNARAEQTWNWKVTTGVIDIFEEIGQHAEKHPEWLTLSAPYS